MKTHDEYIQEFREASEDDQKAMMFDALMNLLADAVAGDDIEMVKAYARLVTEMWKDLEDLE